MQKLKGLNPKRVFEYFEEISSIPRGSGDMEKISKYCTDFAKNHSLKFYSDSIGNVVIYKNGTSGYENSAPVILQGHLDMVCLKEADKCFYFTRDGIDLYYEDGYIKANGTTLGADNGIAVAMILAILEDKSISHPPIEAVLTVDEETGLLGASALNMSVLKGKKMINIDSESDTITISCAGGSDMKATKSIERVEQNGSRIRLALSGLQGGHSGVEIDKGRVNALVLAGRILNHLKESFDFNLISVFGGDKSNAIPNFCEIELVCDCAEKLISEVRAYLSLVQSEIHARESGFSYSVEALESGSYKVFESGLRDKLIFSLLVAPNGVCEYSAEIDGLVETSLNLGVLRCDDDVLMLHYAFRSNKQSALDFIEKRQVAFFESLGFETKCAGHYPPWEYREKSAIRELYSEVYREKTGRYPVVEALHAGLECGIFASQIEDFDCIAIGPEMFDVHTAKERLKVSSVEFVYDNILKVLERSK